MAPHQEGSGSSLMTTCESRDCTSVALSAIPTCALTCFFSYAPSVSCGVLDFSCQCQSTAQAAMSTLMRWCVMTECLFWSIPGVIFGANSVCECATGTPTPGACLETEQILQNVRRFANEPTLMETANLMGSTETTDCALVAKTAIPTCAQPCIAPLPPRVGCGLSDFACQCKDEAQASLSSLAASCVLRSCGVIDIGSLIVGGSESTCEANYLHVVTGYTANRASMCMRLCDPICENVVDVRAEKGRRRLAGVKILPIL